jgi:hypothetical protein
MFPENLLSNVRFVAASPDAVAAATDLDGVVIDMAQDEGYDGICLVASLGDVTAAATPNLRLMGSALANGSSPVLEAETGVTAAAGASNFDDTLMILDVRCPANRYVFARLQRVGTLAVNAIIAILYKARKVPVTQGADVVKSVYNWVLSS